MYILPNNNVNGVLQGNHHQQMCSSMNNVLLGSISSSLTKSTTRQVTFNEAALVYPHLHIRNFTETETSGSWYSVEELDSIKEECHHSVNLSIHGKLRPDMVNNWCFRGLEFRTPEGARSRRDNKNLAWNWVLEEQENQYKLGMFDAEEIARKYRKVSVACHEAAHVLALEDAREVAETRLLSDIDDVGKPFVIESTSSSRERSSLNKRPRTNYHCTFS